MKKWIGGISSGLVGLVEVDDVIGRDGCCLPPNTGRVDNLNQNRGFFNFSKMEKNSSAVSKILVSSGRDLEK